MVRLLSLPAVLVLVAGLAACGTDDGTAQESTDSTSSPSGPTTDCTYTEDGQTPAKEVDPPSSEAPATGEVDVTLATNQGDIGATLDAKAAPCTVHSFVSLIEQGYFDQTPCHRLTTQGIFVLQCGDPSGTGSQGPGYSFDDELSGEETYPAGTVAMANAGPDTNGSQFFLVYEDTELPPSYTVFGTLDDTSVDLVRAVAEEGVQGGQADGPPASEVVIESATVG
ncbi:peptidylprolyl isomerase [Nocardioides sp. GXQ0305]|uniref:peptidylprolyl isomerase n=1 Tax=Nocardioides sp. GXQ0305 TaxID=3423912 RepID=UPI003D7CA90C